jgi:hypothetical protein
MASQALRRGTFFIPFFLEILVDGCVAMGAFFPMGNYAPMAFLAIRPDRSLLVRRSGFTNGNGQNPGNQGKTEAY